MASEKNFENRIKSFLKSNNCYFIKYWGGGEFTKAGVPDILACCNGRFLGIEVKAKNGKPSPLQIHNLKKIDEAGGYGILLYPDHFELFKNFIDWTTGSDTTSSYAGATGSTASLGNGTGRATKTTTYEGGKATDYTVDGKTSICYRGVENFWGNIWKFAYGINFYCEVGKPFLGYVCKDFNYAESKRTDNYENIGFALPSENGYVSAMGYSTKYDWLFLPSEVKGNSSLPVGDYYYQNNTWDGYRIARLGGSWINGSSAGGFYWGLDGGVGYRYRDVGGRLVYVPTVTV